MEDELSWMPAWKLRERIAVGELSPLEVTEHALARIEAFEPHLHSFITVTPDLALDQARAAERAVAAGDELGPLHGVPISIKDTLSTGGVRTTAGSLLFADRVPEEDGAVAARVRASGAILVGKSNTPEFAMFGRTYNRLVPESVNPWDPTRISGASSGGAAAGVATGLTPIAVGTDGGGSIRLPAHCSGVVGLLPTKGRVSNFGEQGRSTNSGTGPLARDVRDVALLLQVMSGPDRRDPTTLREPPPDFLGPLESGIAGLRLAWTPDFGHLTVEEPAVVETVAAAARRLTDADAFVDEPGIVFDDARPLIRIIDVTAESSAFLRGVYADPARRELLSPFLLEAEDWSPGRAPEDRSVELRAALAERDRILANLAAIFERYDAVLSPTLDRTAPRIPPGWEWACSIDDWIAFTYLANLSGYPALSVPAGFVDGLPVGLQVMTRPGDEATGLRVARALEQIQPWADRHPPVPGG